MKKFTKIAAIALAGAMMLSVAACGSISRAKSAETTVQAHYDELGGAQTNEMRSAVEGDGYYADYEETAAYSDDDISSNPNTSTNVYPYNAMLIRRVSMNVETTQYDTVTSKINAKVNELGGYIESSSASGTGNKGSMRRITYTIRVPLQKLDEIINLVGSAATVISSNETTEDVTLQYSDIQSRIKSLRVEQDTLMELLAKADSLEAIITLQNRLTEVRYEIESYESRAKVLENQSTYSTLTLNINEVLEVTEPEEARKLSFGEEIWEGLKESLLDIKEDSKDFTIGFVSALPHLIIFAIFVLIIVLIVKAIIKSSKKKAAKRAAAKAVPAAPAAPAAPANKPEPAKVEEAKEVKEEKSEGSDNK